MPGLAVALFLASVSYSFNALIRIPKSSSSVQEVLLMTRAGRSGRNDATGVDDPEKTSAPSDSVCSEVTAVLMVDLGG